MTNAKAEGAGKRAADSYQQALLPARGWWRLRRRPAEWKCLMLEGFALGTKDDQLLRGLYSLEGAPRRRRRRGRRGATRRATRADGVGVGVMFVLDLAWLVHVGYAATVTLGVGVRRRGDVKLSSPVRRLQWLSA